MENYHYLNQKTEIPTNQDKLFFPFNKNIQYQNFFRGDSNINKQKGRIYNLNNKKEIHFTNRVKDNEIPINGPKMLTMNFPPGFMNTDNNNNSRKNASHEKNIYMQQNMANNMELNEIGSDNEKMFSNTVKKGFQDINDSKDKENKRGAGYQKTSWESGVRRGWRCNGSVGKQRQPYRERERNTRCDQPGDGDQNRC